MISRAVKENFLDYLVKENEMELSLDKDVNNLNDEIEDEVVFLQVWC